MLVVPAYLLLASVSSTVPAPLTVTPLVPYRWMIAGLIVRWLPAAVTIARVELSRSPKTAAVLPLARSIEAVPLTLIVGR